MSLSVLSSSFNLLLPFLDVLWIDEETFIELLDQRKTQHPKTFNLDTKKSLFSNLFIVDPTFNKSTCSGFGFDDGMAPPQAAAQLQHRAHPKCHLNPFLGHQHIDIYLGHMTKQWAMKVNIALAERQQGMGVASKLIWGTIPKGSQTLATWKHLNPEWLRNSMMLIFFKGYWAIGVFLPHGWHISDPLNRHGSFKTIWFHQCDQVHSDRAMM